MNVFYHSIKFVMVLNIFDCIKQCESNVYHRNQICTPIKQCPEAVDLLQTKPLTNNIKEQLFDLQCEEDTEGVKVWCEKPNLEQVGYRKCVPIKECVEIVNLLTRRPITESIKQYIKSLQCGNVARFPKVWCEIKPNNDDFLRDPDLLPDPDNDECGVRNQESKITHVIALGEDVELGEFPWMAMLEYRLKNNKLIPQCAGTLINDRYVLTAAHCLLINAGHGKLESILFGIVDKNEPTYDENRYQIESFTVHPLFVNSAKLGLYHNDIGLIRVDEEIFYTAEIFPICLPSPDFKESMKEMEIAGWGTTEDGTVSPELQKLRVPYLERTECSELLMYNVTETQLCAGGEPGRDACKGDSGGPLMYYNHIYTTQVGIASLSIGKTCGSGRPNIYTNVQKFITWIYDSVEP